MFETLLLDFLTRTYRNAAHSIFSPSGSAMWLRCAGSLIPNLLAKDTPSFEAVEGTVAHELAESWLLTGERPDDRVGEVVTIVEGGQSFDIEITDTMLDYVGEYVDWCLNMNGDSHVEQKVYFSQLTPVDQQGGTSDHFCCEPGVLTITDLKYGQGVLVEVATNPNDPRSIIYEDDGSVRINGNTQAMIYALGVFFKWDEVYNFERIVIRVAQPRRNNMAVWETTRDELLKFADYVKERAHAAWSLSAPRTPSDAACLWCKVKTTCPAFISLSERIADDCFSELADDISSDVMSDSSDNLSIGLFEFAPTQPALLTTEQLCKVFPYKGVFSKWFDSVESELFDRALRGEETPGLKLVEGRSRREFTSEKDAIGVLTEAGLSWVDLYKTSFVSPSMAEELLRKNGYKRKDALELINPVVDRKPGKPVLAKSEDNRPVYQHPADTVFDGV